MGDELHNPKKPKHNPTIITAQTNKNSQIKPNKIEPKHEHKLRETKSKQLKQNQLLYEQ